MGVTVLEILKRREDMRRAVIEAGRRWVLSLKGRLSAFLIGSYARGDFNLWSDVDVVLISDEFSGSPIKRLKELDPPPGFQVIPLTSAEFTRLVEKKDVMALEALKEGVVLRDDLGIRAQPSDNI